VVENQVDVAALREGVIVSILAEPNTQVRKGQLLARLDDRQISADLDAASAKTRSIQANLKNWEAETKVLESDLTRAQKLWEAGVFTRETLEHAQYKVEADRFEISRETELLTNAQATERSLELEKEKTRITAPFDGIVARRYVRVGQKVAISDRLFWVTAVSPLEVKFTLPERFVGKLKNGQTVTVELTDGSSAVHHTATVRQISPVVDPSSGTIEIVARLQGPAPDLRPGMLATIRLNNPK
jgi:RND family efflux transporter MFP subunit